MALDADKKGAEGNGSGRCTLAHGLWACTSADPSTEGSCTAALADETKAPTHASYEFLRLPGQIQPL